jgi:hypothetical protein
MIAIIIVIIVIILATIDGLTIVVGEIVGQIGPIQEYNSLTKDNHYRVDI